MQTLNKLPVSLLCLLAFIAMTPATYAVDCSSASFKVAPTINLEAGLFGMATADFDGDGHLDLAVILNASSSEVLLLSGRGGTDQFGPPIGVQLPGRVDQVTVGDFNGDTKPDLVVNFDDFGQPTGRIAVLINNGTGQFLAPKIVTVPGDPSLPIFGDLNNDGKLDLVTALFTGVIGGRIVVLLGDGTGGLTQVGNFTTNSVNQHEVLIGDFNEDGKADLALPGQSFGTIDIMLGDGTGAFAAGISRSTGAGSSMLTAGHFNNDGHLDILSGNRMMLGTGTADFNAPIVLTIPGNTSAAITGDANNDTNLDLVVSASSGLTILLGDGNGNLTRAKSYTSGANGFIGPSFAVFGDFNEDGKMDLAAAQLSGIGIMIGDGDGAFHDALSYHSVLASPRGVVVADFNNDGKKDFAALGQPFGGFPPGIGVEVALGDGAGNFTRKSFSDFGFQGISRIATADFNGDGKADLAVTRPADGRVYILINDGTGGFAASANSVPNFFVGFQPSAIKDGDFNNDNKADLIVITPQTNNFSVMLGDGSGGFSLLTGIQLQGTSSFFDDVDVGDFNADGKADLAVVRSGSNTVQVLQGNGFGFFSNYATAPTPTTPISVVVRDLNGDGKPDIAATSSGQQGIIKQAYVTVLINNGAGGFTSADYPNADAGGMIGVGDFNDDNQPDLVVTSGFILVGSSLAGVSVLTNNGNGQFKAPINFSAGPQSGYLAVADFNSDNEDDVLFTQPTGASVALLLNDFMTSLPCLTISDASVTETDSGTTNAVFTVTLSEASAQIVKVNYFTFPLFSFTGSAIKGVDFENLPDTLTFLPGETSKTINVPVKGDLIDEFDQLFAVVLTTPINATISTGRGLGTIVDNDEGPTISVNDTSVTEGTQFPQSSATFTVSLSSASEKPISVQFGFAPGTATNSVDYDTFSGLATLEFAPGETSKNTQVSIRMDNVFEPDETFFIDLSNPTNATIADAQGQATITNDDPQPTVSVAVQTLRTEGAQGTSGNAAVEVRLSNPSFQTITVSFATASGSATAGTDYVTTSGDVTFNPGETLKTIPVQVNGDNIDEINETILVNLTSPVNATLGTAQGTVLIQDDDGPTLSIGDVSVTEGNSGITNAVFTVTLSSASVQDISVNFSTVDGTAFSGFDFLRIFSNTLFIPAGATSATITVRVLGELVIENDETFFVNLQFASSATIADGQGQGSIVNDDSNGKLQFSSATFSATEDSGGVIVTINRVDGATGVVNVDFETSNGTATAGSDYPATAGKLTFNQGETSKSLFIAFVSDSVFEGDETLNVSLSNPSGGVVLGTPVTAVLTIKTPPLFLILEESALDPNQVAAVDSLWFTRDPFLVIPTIDLLGQGADKNTRVLVFVTNLQLAPNDVASTVRVNLVDSGGQTHDIGAEDIRVVPGFNFTQIKFRLPDNLPPGACTIKISAHDQESNTGTIRITNP
ncbi:MAG TPA: FG-GAP-like repeat-containing protein [Pyrinomonadaceae bacterium]|nr:FG-GAP-like repeat-containing protein [Pyrinomonadaceae bacterium]